MIHKLCSLSFLALFSKLSPVFVQQIGVGYLIMRGPHWILAHRSWSSSISRGGISQEAFGGAAASCCRAVIHTGASPSVLRRPLLAEALSALHQRAQLEQQHKLPVHQANADREPGVPWRTLITRGSFEMVKNFEVYYKPTKQRSIARQSVLPIHKLLSYGSLFKI